MAFVPVMMKNRWLKKDAASAPKEIQRRSGFLAPNTHVYTGTTKNMYPRRSPVHPWDSMEGHIKGLTKKDINAVISNEQ